jgi:AcrR family transcriptional regulator
MSQRMVYQTEKTRENILQIAVTLFLEQGFHKTQMKDVAEATGMSRNTLYRYFKDKGDLGVAILDIALARVAVSTRDVLAEVEQSGSAQANGRETLIAAVTAVMLGGERDAELRYIAELEAYIASEGILARHDKRIVISQWMLVEKALGSIAQKGVADGSIRGDIDPEFLVWMILTSSWVLQKEVLAREEFRVASGDNRLGMLLPTWIKLVSDGLKPQQ